MMQEYFKSKIRNIPDFPKKGIIFRDITILLNDPEAFRKVIDEIYDRCRQLNITKVVAIESRGFMFGATLAYKLGCGFVPVRKQGKLPYETVREEYALEYGTDALEIHVDSLSKEDNVVIVDDLLATGGTLRATCDLVERLGAKIACVAVLIELSFLGGQEKLKDYNYFALIKYNSE